MNLKTVLSVILVSSTLLGVAVVSADYINSRRLVGFGSVKMYSVDLGLYFDPAFTKKCTGVDWGEINPGDTGSQLLYARNEGNYDSALSMYTNNWQPSSVPEYMTLNWNATSTVLPVNQTVCILFWLTVDPEILNVVEFSFNIHIVSDRVE